MQRLDSKAKLLTNPNDALVSGGMAGELEEGILALPSDTQGAVSLSSQQPQGQLSLCVASKLPLTVKQALEGLHR